MQILYTLLVVFKLIARSWTTSRWIIPNYPPVVPRSKKVNVARTFKLFSEFWESENRRSDYHSHIKLIHP
ncbi:hypothetical protein AUI06_08325 [archaeon 13_2_20CM_2_52_21]|nr:MAG: hypothetical protein AUI06_08325 [archaeon 13_2_20CM_2_52_21]OLD09256.1 MAG: hypothetical protein AUI95_01230 [Crenarchaeota archaeon 13_1_40CM_3_52_4]